MFKKIFLPMALLAPAFVQANEISTYVQENVAGVYRVNVYGLNQQPGPIRLGYADGDRLAMDLWGKKKFMQIHSVDADVGAVNLVDGKGDLSTLSMQYGNGSMTLENGVELHLSILRRLTDIDKAALRKDTPPVAALITKTVLAPAELALADKAPTTHPMPVGPIKASFDCTKASTAVEGMICGNAELAALDVRLAAAYKALRNDAQDKAALKQEQVAWIKQRNACRVADCLITIYSERAEAMESALAHNAH
ncbi:DUF1311 domain-containing protein [Pseudomonas gregormendelii]|uniref:DUF1311 domain-containing protein n=1 Tax=Pseudomonas gregormendelii TaxID=1628277 RepID=A0ABS3AM49_9PSED|nr:lysozyme inhibitor LprI family protein [Pseudomonas gregormendelii]MBN3968225.1 DUF1311 domain-containing protein [Pseudomonas gregormendelii]